MYRNMREDWLFEELDTIEVPIHLMDVQSLQLWIKNIVSGQS